MLLATSHTRMVWSFEPEARLRPSGDQATDQMALVWPSRRAVLCPQTTSQRRMVLSFEPEARLRPSGDQATDQTALV